MAVKVFNEASLILCVEESEINENNCQKLLFWPRCFCQIIFSQVGITGKIK